MQADLPTAPVSRGGPTGRLAESIPDSRLLGLGARKPGGVDRLALTWVKPALEEAWQQVHSSLEAFVQDPANTAILRPALEQLHHLAGVFGLVEMPAARLTLLEAGRLLARLQYQGEAEAVATSVSMPQAPATSGAAMQRPNAASHGVVVEPLLVAVSRVALYVELLRRGTNVPELALLSACNGLRRAQELPIFGPRTFLERIALMQAEPFHGRTSPLEVARSVAAKAHALLQRALLAWLKAQPQADLAVANVFAIAARGASTRDDRVLWWSAEVLGRTLGDPRLAQASGLKPLLGRLNRALQQRADAGFAPSPQTALGANELAHEVWSLLAQHVSQHPAFEQAIALLDWPSQPPGALESEAAEHALLVAEPEVLAQAAQQLKAALDPVQDRFDLAVRSGDTQAILDLAPDLDQLAATMRMLELDAAAQTLETEASRLRDAKARRVTLDEGGLEQVAGALMRADVEIERLRLGLPDGDGVGVPMLIGATNAAVVQGLEDLLLAKELLLTMWKDGGGEARLGEVRQLLQRVRGSFEMLTLSSWASLLDSVLDYLVALPPGTVPTDDEQEAVADVFASLEYGLENLRDYRQVSERVLAFGEQALALLRSKAQVVPMSHAFEKIAEPVMHADAEPPRGEQATAQDITKEQLLLQPQPRVEATEPIHEDVSPPAVAEQPLEHSSKAAGAQLALEVPRLVPEETDSELLQIFIEEARDVLETIRVQFQQWRNEPGNQSALVSLRRAFHTLKGSGRMIGAQLIGEFGWAFENLLNRVIEGVLPASGPLFQLLEFAPMRLEQLIDALEGKPGLVVAEVETLCQTASAFLSEGPAALNRLAGLPKPTVAVEPLKETAPSSSPAVVKSTVQTPVVEPMHGLHPSDVTPQSNAVPAGVAGVPRIDPQLYAIFRNEVEGYLQALRQAAERGRHQGHLHADAELIRITHSLLGSSRTVGASRIVALAEHLEHVMRLAVETQQVLDTSFLNLIDSAVDSIVLLLDDIGGLAVELPDLDRLMQELGDAVVRLQSPQRAHEVAEAAEAAEAAEVAEVAEATEAIKVVEVVKVSPQDYAAAKLIQADAEDYDIPADQDQALLAIFREESEEILQKLDEALASWQRDPSSKALQHALQRHLHTFKGGARMAGMRRMGDLAHHLENVFMDLEANRYTVNPALLTFIQRVFDHLHGMVDCLRDGQPIAPATELVRALEGLREHGGIPQEGVATSAPAGMEVAKAEPAPATIASRPAEETPTVVKPAAPDVREAVTASPVMGEVLRVRAALLDRMVTSAGESAIYQARLAQLFTGFARQLHELDQIVTRLRTQLRRMEIETEAQMIWRVQQETGKSAEEFDPLEFDRFTLRQELSRGVMESLADIESVQDALQDAVREAEMLLTQQSRLGRVLQDDLMSARLVRFEEVVPRLKRLVRQVSHDLGKQAELVIEGGGVELDRGLLNTLVPAFEHMLRNALAHGIEPPEERATRGKNPVGRIHLRIASEGSLIRIVLEDDGAGIDVEAVRRKAREKGILDARVAKDDQAAFQLIFYSGISTAREVSMLAGRGVGMDVVAEALRQAGGDIQVDSRRGAGTSFKLHVPLTQSITLGVAFTVGEQVFALPYSGIEAILRAPQTRLNTLLGEDEPTWEYAGQSLPLIDLGTLLNLPSAHGRGDHDMSPLVVLRLGERRMVLRVDTLQGSQQLFIKALGPFLSKVPALAGATLLGDGRVVLVLDVAGLFRLASRAQTKSVEAQETETRRPQVLVVDDSITIRKVTTRTLERYGIEVVTAKDGVDALAWLRDHLPTVVLSDIEMPRMDGFELLASIRNDARLRDLPVIMITSRTGQKHREKAEALEVSAYLGKPYTEADLINTLRPWLPGEIALVASTAGGVV